MKTIFGPLDEANIKPWYFGSEGEKIRDTLTPHLKIITESRENRLTCRKGIKIFPFDR
jgi:hypothetical protein